MTNSFVQELMKLDLSEKEASTFLTLLSIGRGSVQDVATSTKINRSTAYLVLESLGNKGLVNVSKDRDKLEYEAVRPSVIKAKAKALAEQSLQREKQLHSLLPKLEIIQNKDTHYPKTRFFEGIEGIKTVYREISRTEPGSTLYSLTADQELKELETTIVDAFIKKCLDRKLSIHEIQSHAGHVTGDASAPKLKTGVGFQRRSIPADSYPYSSNLYLLPEKVAFISFVEEFAVILESKEFADVMKEAFKLAWEEAGRLDKKINSAKKAVRQ